MTICITYWTCPLRDGQAEWLTAKTIYLQMVTTIASEATALQGYTNPSIITIMITTTSLTCFDVE